MQILLARIFHEKGHDVTVIYSDIIWPACEMTTFRTDKYRRLLVSFYNKHIEKLLEQTDLKVFKLSDLVKDYNSFDISSYDSSIYNEFIDSMMLRFYELGEIKENAHNIAYKKRLARATIISEKMGQSIFDLNPDFVIMGHGSYTTRAPARLTIENANINVVTIGRGKQKSTQKFVWNKPSDWWGIDEIWEKESDYLLDDLDTSVLNSYLDSRKNHSNDIMVYNFGDNEEQNKLIKDIGIDSNATTYVLFTNVLWDAASAKREIVFKNSLDWICCTIDYFKNNPEKGNLLIRIHPAESIIGTQQPIAKYIQNKYNNLPNNIKVIEPQTGINSWALYGIMDLGIVHTSTVGIELAMEGIPVICVSKTHYRDKGFTVDVKNKEEYFKYLNMEMYNDTYIDKIRKLSLKYSYFMFLRFQIPFPFFRPESHINIEGVYEKSFTDENLSIVEEVCDQIANNELIYLSKQSFDKLNKTNV